MSTIYKQKKMNEMARVCLACRKSLGFSTGKCLYN